MSKAKSSLVKFTDRDRQILEALERFPLTADQLCRFSQTFEKPFENVDLTRRRMRKLIQAGWVQKFPYAFASFGGSPAYYKLTRAGYRMLYGFDAVLPPRRFFEAIGHARHPHTKALSDLLVHLFVSADRAKHEIVAFSPENCVKIETQHGVLRPDATSRIGARTGRHFNFVVELDNGTERVQSKQDVESIQRKVRGYDSHSQGLGAFDPSRYVVLFVTTRSEDRLRHMMAVAHQWSSNPQRRLFLGATLTELLSKENLFDGANFLTADFQRTTLLPRRSSEPLKEVNDFVPSMPAFC